MGKRLDAALAIRDAALKLLRSEGRFLDSAAGRLLEYQADGLNMLHRTPFWKRPPIPAHLKYLAACDGKQVGPTWVTVSTSGTRNMAARS